VTGPRRRAIASSAVAFVSGGVLLGVELAASRVVAPYFGNSLFVWGALIGVVLTGLSIGYWLGGVVVDRLPRASLVVAVLLLGGLAVLAIPFVDDPVLEAIVNWDPGPRADPLLAALILFGPASVILASVTPIVVRLLLRSLQTAGRTAGRLFSISTAGSIVGTFVTAFWLIPELGLDQLLALLAAALFTAAVGFALVERLLPAFGGALAALVLAVLASISLAPHAGESLSAAQAQNWSPLYRLQRERGRSATVELEGDVAVVYRKETRYHRLAVVDDATSRFLRFDASYQSGMFLGRPFRTRFDYTDFFDLALAYRPSTTRMLFIGLGGASAPKRLWRDFPQLQIDIAELDPVVVDVARRYFSLPTSRRLHVDVEDGRRYLARRDGERWDAISIDAFFSDSIPFHLTTREFLELVRDRLEPGGVVVTNVIGALEGPDSKLFRALYRTYASVFPTVLVHPVHDVGGDVTSVRNIMLVATESPPVARAFLRRRWADVRRRHPRAPSLAQAIADRRDVRVRTDDVPLLTDDYAPTDALLYVG
jgi:spermidine synthase